jgi:hypothetical protein
MAAKHRAPICYFWTLPYRRTAQGVNAVRIQGWIALGVAGVLAALVVPVLAQPSVTTAGRPLALEQAERIAQQILDRTGYAGLELDEIQEFSNNFYVAVRFRAGGRGAFEFLIDRYSGFVHPEPQTMMWNTQFGHMAGLGGPGPGGYGPGGGYGYGPGGTTGGGYGYGPGGMMGGGDGYGPGGMTGGGGWTQGAGPGSPPAVAPTVTAAQAKTIAQTFLNSRFPGTKVRNVDAFPGYYTIDVTRDGKIAGMLSVNAYSGQVWYHRWHGAFIQEKELH